MASPNALKRSAFAWRLERRAHRCSGVLRRALLQLAWGFGLGTVAAFGIFTLLRNVIFDNVGPDDPVTIASIVLALVGVSLAASALPALRAMRLSPVGALRHE
jgi:ABC-type antimicrobial peptide transport system permease subunit